MYCSFGLMKNSIEKTTVDCVDHIVEVVKRSNKAGLNKAQCYDNSVLGIFFKKLSSLQNINMFSLK